MTFPFPVFCPRTLVSTAIGSGTGSVIGNMTTRGGTAAAFNGNANQAALQSAGISATSGFVGKDWGSGVFKTLSRFKVTSPNNTEWTVNNGGTITMELRGSNSAPSTGSEGSLLHTSTAVNTGTSIVHDKGISAGVDVSSAYRYHWVRISHNLGGGFECVICEVDFEELL
ncbi:hypothetical protein GIW81_00855 [Hyphomicrobium sp. xq]|uniref:Uncharacterized protein n=1 Tax=Hyphomicrobium album TaxID=2665159 RepID=A0A6I3KGK3_9HYPH|nr:hypothetical protein [Hyphomicrobium album]MTD92877.1 hypothetical protein [Hyphomicrobium album]